ncbi:MAG TPA: hypothetical protein VGL66_13120 [Caulobacteraceae bacterium]|jgi:hypothetical protein
MPVVASISIDAVSPEGETFVVELAVGMPYQCETGEWACPVALGGLYDRLSDIRGEDSFQALCLAIRLAQDLLQDFCEKGGKLLMGTEDFPLEAYAFRRAIPPAP